MRTTGRARSVYVKTLGLPSAALLLAACGGAGTGGPAADKPADDAYAKKPAGSLSTSGFGLGDEIATARVEAFEKANPDVALKVNEGGFDEQQFLSAVAGGTPPDAVYVPRDTIGTYAARGALLPLDDCIQQRKIDMAQYRPAALEQVRLDGKHYGIPEFFNSPVIILNNVVLEEAGLTPADIDLADQQKMLDAAKKMTVSKGGKLTRLGFDFKVPDMTPLYGVIDGQPFITDATTVKLEDPATVATFERLKALHDAQGGYKDIQEFKDTWDFFGEKNQFARNQVGGIIVEQWYLNVLADASPDVDITVVPITDKSGKPITWASGSAWAIPKGAKNPAAACEFARIMTAPETWVAAAKERAAARAAENKVFTGTYTANTKADEVIFSTVYKPAGGKYAAFEQGVETVLSVQDSSWTVPASPVGAQFKAAWQTASTKVMLGQLSAAEALQQAQQSVDSAIAKVKK